jgi:hypothetical protein
LKDFGMRFLVAALLVGLSAAAAGAQNATLPRAAIEDAFKNNTDCTVPIEQAAEAPESFDLGGGQTLFIVKCWGAAYQFGQIIFVMDAAGKARPLTFQNWNGKRFAPAKSLTEADFDPNKKTMSSFYKGRGLGDCGSMGEWVWTGSEFKLAKFFHKEKCDGRLFSGEKRWRDFLAPEVAVSFSAAPAA